MNKGPFIPLKWHIYVVNLDPKIQTKPGKQRPCIVIQPNEFSEAGLQSSVVLPLTTKLIDGDNFPLRVRIPEGVCGLKKPSDVLVSQILTWSVDRFREDLGIIPEHYQDKIKDAVVEFFDF